LAPILGLVLLGMLHGRNSLRASWIWVQQHTGSDEVAALLVLLREVPLTGRTVTMDGGLLIALRWLLAPLMN